MVKFYLDTKKDKKKGEESPIFLSLHHRGRRIKLYTGKKIDPDKWNENSQRANSRKYKNNPLGFNKYLNGIADEVETLVNENKVISKSDIKSIIDKALGKNSQDTLFGFAESYIRRQLDKGKLKPISAKGYRTALNHIRELNPSLSFTDITLDFYDKFVSYLKKKGLSPNSIGAQVKRLKWVMAAALDRDLHNNIAFKKKAFKVDNEDVDEIYLTRSEIEQLEKAKLSESLKKVADAFVINCSLGLRFSDLIQVQKSNFSKEGNLYYLNMVQGKGDEKIRIPIPPGIVPLLTNYKFRCPVINNKGKLMSLQKFNDYVKEAGKLTGLDSLEQVRKNGIVQKKPKFSLIKSHTARRSFATNLYLEDVPIQNIMAITGHKRESTFLLYVRADQLTKSRGLARHYQKDKPIMKVNRSGTA